jgi:signal transduction histidine kinase
VRIALVSIDESLLPLCQDIVNRLPVAGCAVELAEPRQPVEADLYIWDMDSKPRFAREAWRRPPGNDVFLVRRSGLKEFLTQQPQAAASTLLKPVSPATLEVFLTQFVSRLVNTAEEPASTALDTLPSADQELLLDCLLHANLRLQEFEDDRTNFWARAAHDLRAPLTAAGGYCGLLLEEQTGPLNSTQRELLERMQNSLRRLSRMASAMFQLTAGKMVERKFELKRTDIEKCIRHSVEEVRFFATEKNLTLDVAVSSPGQPLYLEFSQIEQVLVNLLENACKFTPRNGRIEVRGYPAHCWGFADSTFPFPAVPAAGSASKSTNGYRVDIRDSGPGIPADHLPHIFDEYVSYGTPKDRSGGGLGLAICRMILRAHHGRIWAEADDRGTTFSFIVPFNPSVIQDQFEPAASHAG